MGCGIESADRAFIRVVDAALAEAARKSGPWLACRIGCTQCCVGPFRISQLDAWRLRRGLESLDERDPGRAARVRRRVRESVERLSPGFPGDPATGILAEGEQAKARFDIFADDEPCPALDPQTGACDLYEARPLTCRAFGPPVRCGSEAVAVCELCFEGASDAEIAACEVQFDTAAAESALLDQLGEPGETIVAFALAKML
jgi:Fe-S-cluster containining protein